MITLGINAAFHDSAAALVVDGVPAAAAEEERYTRTRHAKRPLPFTAWELPYHAIASCLEHAGITMAAVDHVAYSFDPVLFAAGRDDLVAQDGTLRLPLEPSARRDERIAPWHSPWDPLLLAYAVNAPRLLRDGVPHDLRKCLAVVGKPPWRWHDVGHALCHQASAFLAAPFERCAVMTLEGRGERATTTYGVWRDGRYRRLGEVLVPHSLGLLYERATTHLGFLHSSDESKVMALAACGRPQWADAIADRIVVHDDGRYEVGDIDFAAFAPPREKGAALEPCHHDLAASLQAVLERTVLRLAAWLRRESGETQLAMAGGVALNCLMNARLRDEGPFERVWIQPAAGDAGTALGAALWVDARERLAAHGGHAAGEAAGDAAAVGQAAEAAGAGLADVGTPLAPRRWTMEHAYLGPAWSDDEIAAQLRWAGLDFERHADDAELIERTAALLALGHIVGWFQGRMEWGPCALGARSIIASPIDPGMQARLNELNDREDFGRFAPVVTAECFAEWFARAESNGGSSPFMLFTYPVLPKRAGRIPSACQGDGSARVQTVERASNPRLHALLESFARRTGVPVLANTAFSVRGAPIVCTPQDAIQAWASTPIAALVIGNCIVTKRQA